MQKDSIYLTLASKLKEIPNLGDIGFDYETIESLNNSSCN